MLDMGGRSVKRRQQIEKCLQREAAEHLEHDRLGGNASKCQHHESPQSWKVVGIIPQLPYFRLSLVLYKGGCTNHSRPCDVHRYTLGLDCDLSTPVLAAL